jgi:hypothetical protein
MAGSAQELQKRESKSNRNLQQEIQTYLLALGRQAAQQCELAATAPRAASRGYASTLEVRPLCILQEHTKSKHCTTSLRDTDAGLLSQPFSPPGGRRKHSRFLTEALSSSNRRGARTVGSVSCRAFFGHPSAVGENEVDVTHNTLALFKHEIRCCIDSSRISLRQSSLTLLGMPPCTDLEGLGPDALASPVRFTASVSRKIPGHLAIDRHLVASISSGTFLLRFSWQLQALWQCWCACSVCASCSFAGLLSHGPCYGADA